MRKRPELPPELADAIEFTAEYRHAMGLDEDPEPITEPPSKEELANKNAWITADEYLACFGYASQPFTPIFHGLRGRRSKWK